MTSCQFNATLNGIGDFVVASATAAHVAPESANVTDGKTYTYYAQCFDTAVPPNVVAWEAGNGPYTISTHKLKRAVITANSNGDLLPVNFPTPPIVDVYSSPSLSLEPVVQTIPQGHIFGLTMSTAGASATMSIAAGLAADSTGTLLMKLAATMAKTTGAWVAGSTNGGLDTSTIANSTWYHFFEIMNVTTGAVDVVFSATATPASGPTTMPGGYTLFRLIGSGLTNGSAQWTKFSQFGDEFLWDVPFGDQTSVSITSTSALYALTVPANRQVIAKIRAGMTGTADIWILITSPDESTQVVNSPGGNWQFSSQVSGHYNGGNLDIRTNTARQVRAVAFSGTQTLYITTYGWIDTRGRNA